MKIILFSSPLWITIAFILVAFRKVTFLEDNYEEVTETNYVSIFWLGILFLMGQVFLLAVSKIMFLDKIARYFNLPIEEVYLLNISFVLLPVSMIALFLSRYVELDNSALTTSYWVKVKNCPELLSGYLQFYLLQLS